MQHLLAQAEKPANTEVFEASFTRTETQKILKVSRPTLMKLIKTGGLPASKVGSQWRIKPRDLREFIERNASTTARGHRLSR
jgi:excisionase family DNA binding protein